MTVSGPRVAHAVVANRIVAPALLLAGLVLVFHPTFGSRFTLVQTDPGDPRFCLYLLEHSWLWLIAAPTAAPFWSPRMGYPLDGVLAYAEVLVGAAPAYWPWRMLGASPQTSYQLWLVTLAVLNYAVFWLFLRSRIGRDPVACSFGAFLFAFALPRTAQLGHAQLLPQIFVVGAVWGLCVVLDPATPARARAKPWGFAAIVGGLAVQPWCSVYLAYFLAFVLALGLGLGLAFAAPRHAVVALVRQRAAVLLAILVAGVLIVAPLAAQYAAAAEALPPRPSSVTIEMLPRVHSLVFVTPWSWFYGWMSQVEPFASLLHRQEHWLGMGLLTTATVLWVAVHERRRWWVQWTALVAITLLAAVLMWPGGCTLWSGLAQVVPGLAALRAVGRVGLFLLIPASVALAWLIRSRPTRPARGAAIAIAALCCVEQFATTPAYDARQRAAQVDRIAAAIERDATAFYYATSSRQGISWISQVDAILASQQTGVPTVNLYSGNVPPELVPLHENSIAGPADRARISTALHRWIRQHDLSVESVQVVVLSDPLIP